MTSIEERDAIMSKLADEFVYETKLMDLLERAYRRGWSDSEKELQTFVKAIKERESKGSGPG